MSDTLKPCPHCGSAAVASENHKGHRVHCTERFKACAMNARTNHCSTVKAAIAAWNTRAAPTVKPLVWDKHPDENEWYNLLTDSNYGPEMGYTIIETVKGNYRLHMRSGDERVGKFPTFKAAVNAANEHHEHYVLPALEDAT